MKTMTLDDLIKQPLSEEDKKIINESQPVVTEDCPEMSDKQLQQFKPWYEVHKNETDIYNVPIKKTVVTLKIDNDVLTALKAAGDGYQARINNILRKAVLG
ncbi:MAG: BrnA antitoxin family protein [Spirochaetales bacterium]|nr:BrnA antitoxin family protein [Spirochaetales bacterium]